MLQKARKHRMCRDAVAQVQEAVLGGRPAPGRKLPPEREPGERRETGRRTPREAIRVPE